MYTHTYTMLHVYYKIHKINMNFIQLARCPNLSEMLLIYFFLYKR